MKVSTFGAVPARVSCHRRVAAYAVIRDDCGRVATILHGGLLWLPGGGAEPAESVEASLRRELREELGREIRVLDSIGEAIQYFHAADDDCWYCMRSSFVRAEFVGDSRGAGEYELHWLDPSLDTRKFFHECHAWAVARALENRR